MTNIVNKEHNIYSKFNPCGCSHLPTKSYCQSAYCAEVDSNGDVIYRGSPGRGGTTSPPLRNEEGYLNEGGTGHYDTHDNKSRGHKAPCVLQLDITGVTSENYCTDCENINGTYKSLYSGDAWYWPLCTPENRNNACGASFVKGELVYDPNDGFNDLVGNDLEFVRDVYLKLSINSQAIDYNAGNEVVSNSTSYTNLCYNENDFSVFNSDRTPYISGCNFGLVEKRVKVGEVKYRRDSNGPDGYYDNNVQCMSWDELEITDTVSQRALCSNFNFKVTVLPNDDLQTMFVNPNWSELNTGGLYYNSCNSLFPPTHVPPLPTNAITESDSEWNVDRIFNIQPYFYKVSISGADGTCDALNGDHYLGINQVKTFADYDSPPVPEETYGSYDKFECNHCDGNSGQISYNVQQICISSLTFSFERESFDEDEYTARLVIAGQNFTVSYTYVIDIDSTNPIFWFTSPLTLTYLSHTGTLPENCNFTTLSVIVDNANEFLDLESSTCFPIPRSSSCEGGKEPDAFLVEFLGGWEAGYMRVYRPVLWDVSERGAPFVECYARFPDNSCDTSTVLKTVGDCYLCNNYPLSERLGCDTNCANQTWEGPTGSFVLTKVISSNTINNGETGCYNENPCNNVSNIIKYSYKNGTSDLICNWTGISLSVGKGIRDDVNRVGAQLNVTWARQNSVESDLLYCMEEAYHADACTAAGVNACARSAIPVIDYDGCKDSELDCPIHPLGCIVQDPSQPDYCGDGCEPSKRYFYSLLDNSEIENFYFTDCHNENGFLLDYVDEFTEEYYANCYTNYCIDDGIAPATYPNFHGHYTGSNVRITPIYY